MSNHSAEHIFPGPTHRPCTWLLLPPTDDPAQLKFYQKFAQAQWERHYKGERAHQGDTTLAVMADILKAVHNEHPLEPKKVAVPEEVIRRREDRYIGIQRRRQIFHTLAQPHTARCEFGEEIAEDLYQDIAQDIEEFLQDGRLADKAEAHVRANVNPGAGGCCPLCSLPRQNDSTPTWTAQNRVGFSSRPCPECNAMMQRHRQ